jgi:uncharacterized protein (PEP-CTERM system associated)
LTSVSRGRNRYTEANREDTDVFFRVGLTHQLQPKVQGTVQVRLIDRNSDDISADYRERAIVGTLRMSF